MRAMDGKSRALAGDCWRAFTAASEFVAGIEPDRLGGTLNH